MNILFLTKLLPYPLDAGGKIRTFRNIEILSRKHEIHLVSFVDKAVDLEWKYYMKKYCKKITTFVMPITNQYHKILIFKFFLSLINGKPFTVYKYYSSEMFRFVNREIMRKNYEILFIDHINIAQYIPKDYKGKVICDEHDISSIAFARYSQRETNIFFKLIYLLESRKLEHLEKVWIPRFDHIFSISQSDKEQLMNLGARTDKVTFLPTAYKIDNCYNYPQDPPVILFIGLLSWKPNADGLVWFLDNVYPSIQNRISNVKFFIVGKYDHRIQKRIQNPKNNNVKYLGYIEDLDSIYKKATVFVVPILVGGGVRIKLLDAMSRGIPVVSTRIGAEGVEVHDGQEILIRDTLKDFGTAVVKVIKNKNLAIKLSKNGLKFIKKNYSVQRTEEILKIIDNVKFTQ